MPLALDENVLDGTPPLEIDRFPLLLKKLAVVAEEIPELLLLREWLLLDSFWELAFFPPSLSLAWGKQEAVMKEREMATISEFLLKIDARNLFIIKLLSNIVTWRFD